MSNKIQNFPEPKGKSSIALFVQPTVQCPQDTQFTVGNI